ncbi:AsmA-like C-terminal region-containing protein [Oricola sp.]|uniref:AsmA family protein n=1 Tax=Oricola sp. TaxID=1979950 RepID=UPI0025D0FCB3|nr:AsmA-like C-terminal region-containing protein [Oricola sp.]MCI5078453.1 hypothetical protein [Oricola sp.]
MTARVTRIGASLVVLAVVAILALWALMPAFVSSDLVRTAIEKEFEDIAGQQVRIEGRVDIDLFPTPVARLYDLRLPGATPLEGEKPNDLLFVESAVVSIPFSSLLARQPEFSQFRLIRPAMRVLVDDKGRIDIAAIGGRLGREIAREKQTGEASSADPAAEETAVEPGRARFGTVTIENGTVDFVGPDGQARERITALNGAISWPRLDEKLSASLKGIWRGTAFEQKTEIDRALQFLTGQTVTVRQDFTSDVLTYAFNGQLGVGETQFAEGRISLSTPTVRQALDWLGTGIRTGGAAGKLSLSANVRGDMKKLRFDNLNVALQDSAGTGVLELAFRDDFKPSVTATLDFQAMDISAFLSAFTGMPRTREALAEPASADILNQMDVDLRLSAATASFGALRFTDIAAVAQIRGGDALFELADATAYGGRWQAHLKLTPQAGTISGAARLAITDVNGGAVADALQVTGLMPRGTTTGTLDVSAPIGRWRDLFERGDGRMQMSVTAGAFDGVAFSSFGSDAGTQSFFRLRDATRTSEVFDRLDVTAMIRDGVIVIEDGSLRYPTGTVQLSGIIPYGTASLALTTMAAPTLETVGPAPAVQHFIGGSWDNPYAVPVLPAGEDR